MYISAKLSGFSSMIKFVQNGLDEVRRDAVINVKGDNNGGSNLRLPDDPENKRNKGQTIKTVLLEDMVDTIKTLANPQRLLIKMDIELFECRTILGSKSLFRKPQKIPIEAIVMEWLFRSPKGNFSKMCPEEKVIKMTKMFLDAGYVPYKSSDLSELNCSNFGLDWRTDNVLWLMNSTTYIV